MGHCSFLDGLRVTVEEGDMLPCDEPFALKAIIRKVALPMMKELEEQFEILVISNLSVIFGY